MKTFWHYFYLFYISAILNHFLSKCNGITDICLFGYPVLSSEWIMMTLKKKTTKAVSDPFYHPGHRSLEWVHSTYLAYIRDILHNHNAHNTLSPQPAPFTCLPVCSRTHKRPPAPQGNITWGGLISQLCSQGFCQPPPTPMHPALSRSARSHTVVPWLVLRPSGGSCFKLLCIHRVRVEGVLSQCGVG